MELVRRTIRMTRQKGKAVSQMTLDDDYNIPETMPDVSMIVQEKGDLEIGEVRVENGRALIRGNLRFYVLYLDDSDEGGLHSVKGQIPFEENMNVEGAKDGDSLKLNGILEDLFAVLINSRKMGIKAVGTLELTVEELTEEALTTALEGGEQAEIRTEHRTAAALTVQKKDTCRIKDEIILPANKSNIRELIWQDVALRGMELRPGEDEILIKGELGVFVLYESEETEQKTGWLEQSVPFNSHIDVHGSREGIAASLGAVLAGAELEVKPDYDGELRVLHVDAVLNLDIRMYEEEGVDLVADVYSLKKELIPEKAETDYERLLINSASRCRVSGRMTTEQTDMQILQICHSSGEVKLDDCTAVEQGLRVEGAVQVEVLYITSDDSHPILCRKEAIPFEQLIEVPGMTKDSVWYLDAILDQLAVDMVSGTEMDVKGVVLLQILVLAKERAEHVVSVTEEPLDLTALKALPAFVLYAVQPGDTLWEIAKSCRSTGERICEINGCAPEEIRPGKKLILIKEVR